ncbi:MAG: alpha-L-fucosidase [Prevotella sp.]|jgi:alpha-L-fucosidase
MKKNLIQLLMLAATLSPAMSAFAQWPTPPRKTIKLPGGKAKDIPSGPFTNTWESLRDNYVTPQWFKDAKFGIFIHWGVYAVPAHGSEWYPKHMYGGLTDYHAKTWGRQDKFGYKDFIPLFKAEKFNADEWAQLFKDAGAKYVIPVAEHHDGFAMYASKLTRWNAKNMGPKRDVIGELAKSIRAQGLKFGVSNHRMENWGFMYPTQAKKTDLFDPKYADFYGPPQVRDTTKADFMGSKPKDILMHKPAPQSKAFQEEWLARCQEIIDNYQPDILWFDNGINDRSLDPIKLRLAAYYYNSAAQWHKDVTLGSKSDAYLYGTVKDFERQSRAPKELTRDCWMVDDPIGTKFGYIEGMKVQSASSVIRKLVENISRNGGLCLNISPKADGTIPDNQKETLLGVGRWLKINGEGVYSTNAWQTFGENADAADSKTATWRFTQKGKNDFYAFLMIYKGGKVIIKSFTPQRLGKVKSVKMLGYEGDIPFTQSDEGLEVTLPNQNPNADVSVLKVEI